MSDRDPIELEQALIIVSMTFAGLLGAGMLIWMAVVLADMIHTLLLTAGGVGVSIALRKGGKR